MMVIMLVIQLYFNTFISLCCCIYILVCRYLYRRNMWYRYRRNMWWYRPILNQGSIFF